ncbi:MAG: Circadian clock protein KaiA [Chroococcopsis gigantea SAG 12.99]|nr:Circadian clock protein KaiA [Chroococcopsis gigantea SAG 12.99]
MASLKESVSNILQDERYQVNFIDSAPALIQSVEENKEKIDCLVVVDQLTLLPLFNQLYEAGILLPVVIIDTTSPPEQNYSQINDFPAYLYHSGEVHLSTGGINNIATVIERAIAHFLHLAPNCSLSDQPPQLSKQDKVVQKQSFLLLQQRRLAEKLKERLGYLGVYYKRNHQYFYRNLSSADKQEIRQELEINYREIVLNYFTQDYPLNELIDQFVNRVFFTDISISQILEIHMELMDDFSQQLKLEGRSEEILLDYRLALIDVLAHLGEMYRRSIPREDIPYELLFKLD